MVESCGHPAGSRVFLGYDWDGLVRVKRYTCQACGANWTERA